MIVHPVASVIPSLPSVAYEIITTQSAPLLDACINVYHHPDHHHLFAAGAVGSTHDFPQLHHPSVHAHTVQEAAHQPPHQYITADQDILQLVHAHHAHQTPLVPFHQTQPFHPPHHLPGCVVTHDHHVFQFQLVHQNAVE